MKITTYVISLLLVCYFGSAQAGQNEWRTSYPPNPIELDQAITIAFAAKMGATVSGQKIPFARRLVQLKTGEIDILSGLLKKEDREEYAYYLYPPYKLKTNKIFLMRKGEAQGLQEYEDLYQLRVGVQIDSKYFPRFDEDQNIKKIESTKDENRLNMLQMKRFDALIHTELYGTYMVYTLGLQDKVDVAPYKYTKHNPVYMAISKKSELYERKDELEKTFLQMMNSGEMDNIIHSYFESKGLPVPDYK